MAKYEVVKFSDSYGLAQFVWQTVVEDGATELLDACFHLGNTSRATELFARPRRWTLLHECIDSLYQETCIEDFEHQHNDMLDLAIEEYKAILKFYEIPYPEINLPSEEASEYEERVSQIVGQLRSLLPVTRIVHDTFQLLFGDRLFLLKFNLGVSSVVKGMQKRLYPELLDKDGMLKRVDLPVWLKRGVFYRDKGRCIACGKDLTGTIVTGEEVHYDHIISLANGGTNDPTNFQVLCRGCNLRKSKKPGTSEKYLVYWNLSE